MRFLITGASGFVGRQLCEELLRQKQVVRVALRTGNALIEGTESVVVGAVDGETNWRDALRNIDVVIHLAARGTCDERYSC